MPTHHSILLALLGLLLCSCHSSLSNNNQSSNLYEEERCISNILSNQKVSSFAEDAQGHIWIGTFRGLNKHGVHEYHQYFSTDDSLSLPDNQINDIFRDSRGRLWIATVNGVCLYTDKDNFKEIPIPITNKNGYQLLEDKEGRIFLNMIAHLAVYNPDKQCFEIPITNFDPQRRYHLRCHIDNSNNLWAISPHCLRRYNTSSLKLLDSIPTPQPIYSSYLKHNGELWLGARNKLQVFNTRTRKYLNTPTAIENHPLLSHSTVIYIHPYDNNSLLFNTTKNGLFIYNSADSTVIHQDESNFPFEAPRFRISRMFTDSQKNLWIGSIDQGYTVSYSYQKRFNNNNYLRQCVENKSVVSLVTDQKQNLWIATMNDGIYVYNTVTKNITQFKLQDFFPNEIEDVSPYQLFIDRNDNLWIAASPNKVLCCTYQEGKLRITEEHHIAGAMSFTQDRNNTIWIGTNTEYIFARRTGEQTFSSIQLYPILFTFIPGLLPQANGKILVAAFMHPMLEIDPDTWVTNQVTISDNDWQKSIERSVFIPTAIEQDSRGDIWIGTVTNGLLHYDPKTKRMSPVKGTSCLDISSIEEDAQGNIWISTQFGLNKYDRTVNQFTHYYATDGIGGNQFYDRSSCKLDDGTLVFGGTHGLTFFNPIDVDMRHNIPLLFEDLKIHNRLIKPVTGGNIDKHLSYNPDIKLAYNQNGFSISFSALDYCEYERVHYYYKLEGFDNYWIDARNNREAYYANLPAGCYTFKVRITNNDRNIVEAENSITVTVEPAPWRTWWAYTLYLLLAAGVVFLFLRALYRIRLEKEQARRAEQEKEQEQRVNKMNMSFFANVSHEFRTPLTMISGPVTQLCESPEIDGNNKKLLHIVQQSVNRMLRLVNQLMDFNKLENDTLKLKVKRTDVVTELKRIMEIFNVNAQSKDISLITTGIEDSFLMWLDADKIDKITTNLLSNALKFTPRGGKIEVNFDVITGEEARQAFRIPQEQTFAQYIKLEVADTGIGIPEEQTERIFERYYQLNNQSVGSYNWGTGIGLYYARSLAHLHHGLLKAGNRTDGQGAVFTLILPTSDEAYSPEERDNEQQEQGKAYPLQTETQTDASTHDEEEEDDNLKKILVVDDDTEVAHYLKVLLSPTYRVICRFNAEDAFKAVNEEAPDLVLSDVVMPGTDGYTLCRKIKEDLQLCHTPVILVTAKANMEDQVEGLNTGADAYVTKPFDPTYLQALIQSQLKNREKVRALLGRNTQTDAIADDVLSPQDNAFMTELYSLMENELSNPELDISHMTELLKISRTKFYYKVKGLTGENPSSFFKTYKLNRAAELIKEGKYSISEIADMTGFSTHSYFSKAFKKQFGIAPSEYK